MPARSLLSQLFRFRRRESKPKLIRRAGDYAQLERRVVYSAVALGDLADLEVDAGLQDQLHVDHDFSSAVGNEESVLSGSLPEFMSAREFIEGGAVLSHGVPGSIDGTVYEDLLGDGSIAGDGSFDQVDVYLYLDDGDSIPNITDTYLDTQTTATDGTYSFSGLSDGNYWVVVDSTSIQPNSSSMNNPSLHTDMWAEQTYGPANAYVNNGSGAQIFLPTAGAAFGGLNAGVSDNSTRLGFVATDSTPLTTSEHLALVTIATDSHVHNVDFGFSYNVVTTVRGGGDPADTLNHDDDPLTNRTIQGSLRQFIQNANNYAGHNAMRFVPAELPNSISGSAPTNSWWRIDVSHPLDAITDDGTEIDGTAFAFDGSTHDTNTLAVGSTVTTGLGSDSILGTADDELSRLLGIPTGLELEIVATSANITAGIETNASDTAIRNVSVHGFGDGSNGTGNVVVDGLAGAITGVTVESALLGTSPEEVTSPLGNASANVFVDSAAATIRDNVIVQAGRRGVHIAPGALAVVVEGNEIESNAVVSDFADGILVRSAANAEIRDNLINNSGGYGIDVSSGNSATLIENNTITNNGVLGAQTAGIRLYGQNAVVTNNVIANNAGDGVFVGGRNTSMGVVASHENRISRNSFSDNGGIAIDLAELNSDVELGDGISSNDGTTQANSGNLGIDFVTQNPTVLQYDSLSSDIAIGFSTNITLEMYAVTNVDASDQDGLGGPYHGEGTRYLRSYGSGSPAPITHNTSLGFLPTDRVGYLSFDANGNTSEFSVSYDVNFLPLANDDLTSTSGSQVSGNVITNDTDEDGDSLQVSSNSNPVNAQAFSINANGDFSYTPDPLFSGLDTFTYTANDGNGGTRDATVFISVTNTPPNAVNDSYSLTEETSFSTTLGVDGVLLNDSDADGESLTANLVTDVANGTLVLANDGTFTYTPDPNFAGADTFVYEAQDVRNATTEATVTLNVTNTPDPPVANTDSYVVDVNTSFSATLGVDDLLQNDTDPDGDTLTVNTTVVTPPANGIVVLATDGTFTYTPAIDYTGSDSFEYEVDDGTGRFATAIVTLDVNSPPVALPDTYSGSEDQSIVALATVNDLLINDYDPDTGDVLTVNTTPIVGPSNGSLTLNANGSFTYTPTLDFFGTDSFTYEVSDGRRVAQAVATLNIANVNDDPAATNDDYVVDEDTTLSPVLNVDDLRFNDTDIDGDSLAVTTTPITDVSNGSLTLNSDGTFQYLPNADFFGSDSFEYEVTDGNGGRASGFVTITINSVNDEPVANSDIYTINEDNGLTATAGVNGLLENDTDVDVGDSLTITTTPAPDPPNGSLLLFSSGSFSYIPDPDFNGADSFTYEITDGNGGTTTGTVTINVLPVNDAPIAVDDVFSINEDVPLATVLGVNDLLLNDSDVDNDSLTVNPVPITGVSNGTLNLNVDGTFSYAPNSDFFGTDSFSYEVSDGNGGTDVGRADITVLAVNDAPVAVDDAIRLSEDTSFLATIGVDDLLVNDSDVENDPITVEISPAAAPTHGTLLLNGDGAFEYIPQADYNGTDSFVYEITDGDEPGQGNVTIVIDPVPDAPVALNDSYILDEDTVFSATLGTNDLLLNDSDADGDALIVSAITTLPTDGIVTFLADGTFSYAPNLDFFGTDTFVYQITDGLFSTEATVTLTVNPVNDDPVVTANRLLPVAYGTTVTITAEDLYAADVDDLATARTYTTSGLVRGQLEFADVPGVVVTTFTQADIDAGRLVYVHDGTTNPADTFSFVVTDASGATTTGQFDITIGPAPDALDDSYRVTPGKALFVGGQGAVRNDQGLVPSATTAVITPPVNGTLNWNSDGTFDYTPNAGFIGTETIVYQLSSIFGTDTATITISVPPVTPNGGTDSGGGSVTANPDIVEIPVPIPPQRAGDVKTRQTSATPERSYRIEGSGGVDGATDRVTSSKPLLTRTNSTRDARELRSRYTLQVTSGFETGAFNVAFDAARLDFEMGELLVGLDSFHESMLSSVHVRQWNVPRGLALTSGLSIGWVLWGYLIGSLVSATTPTWSMVDPLPIFDSIDGNDKNKLGDGDFLDEMIASRSSK